MGFRFTLESANTVANLTFGKVISCYRDIYSSRESFDNFLYFLDQFQENIYSNDIDRYKIKIGNMMEIISRFDEHRFLYEDIEQDNFNIRRGEILDALHELSNMFDRCKVKSLLLPRTLTQFDHSDDFMTSEHTLNRLAERHPGDSCLILQPKERPRIATVFDAFPNFDVALKQADSWPAVLFWHSQKDYVFVPIEHEDELNYLYEVLRYERHPFGEIRKIADKNTKTAHYLFQLSDLHFGSRNVDVAKRRLKSLVKSQLSSIGSGDGVSFIVTGDAVDSPQRIAENDYRDFSEYIEERCGKRPIRILGNHDIDDHGLSFLKGRRRVANIVGQYPRIEMLNDQKVILLLFNSNTDGKFAKGKIGSDQMSEMGNILDGITNLSEYLLIAALHHHIVPIPKPDFYDYKWYESIIPKHLLEEPLKLIDADLFLEWLKNRNIRFVLHGHKHVPFMAEHNGIRVISCGSSTGQIAHKEKGKTYISYNVLRISEKSITCTQFAEEILGTGAKNIRAETISLI